MMTSLMSPTGDTVVEGSSGGVHFVGNFNLIKKTFIKNYFLDIVLFRIGTHNNKFRQGL